MSLRSASSFQRHGQRDDRRRRLIADELCNADDRPDGQAWPDEPQPQQKSEGYGDAEFLEEQWRVLDLAPQRLIVLGPLFALGLAIAAGLEAAYAGMCRGASAGTRLAAFDISAKGSLACWFSSLVLVAAAVMALLVFLIRRHRTDDYQGRYRVWLWAAGCWFLLATDQAASLREAFQSAMIAATGTPLWGDGTLWWVAADVLIVGAVGSRLLVDTWSCRLSFATLLLAIGVHLAALAGRLQWLSLGDGAQAVMYQIGGEMAGSLLLLLAMALHARYVMLDAQGLIVHREPKEPCANEPSEAEAEDSPEDQENNEPSLTSKGSGRWTKIDPPHASPQPARQRPATVAAASAEPAASETSGNHKLTKAERKAMKERLLKQRRVSDREDW
ncbi:MAG: hypothetical protein ABFC96_02100 [Thermoguttaceae bacterium]